MVQPLATDKKLSTLPVNNNGGGYGKSNAAPKLLFKRSTTP